MTAALSYDKIISGTAPITKNSTNCAYFWRTYHVARGKIPIEKNVIVTDEFGNKLINTYPKRAKGLIKQGRAERVSENEIRLIGSSDPPFTEDNMNDLYNTDNSNNIITVDADTGELVETGSGMLHANEPKDVVIAEEKQYPSNTESVKKPTILFFNARAWEKSKDCPKSIVSRSFISDPFGNLTEAFTVGNWSWEWSQIETKDMILEKNTDYEFVFWLNGGENDQCNEVCRFEIMFDNDYENRYVYNLNRSYIRYERHYKGWYLYRIPFNTGDACYTKLRFISQRSFTTIMHADAVESYNNLPEDLPIEGVPQRHNIVFSEGFPRTSWWSYMVFPESNEKKERQSDSDSVFSSNDFGNMEMLEKIGIDMEMLKNNIGCRIAEEFDTDDIIDGLIGEIGVDVFKERIIRQVKDSLNL